MCVMDFAWVLPQWINSQGTRGAQAKDMDGCLAIVEPTAANLEICQ
jgi:hypothetical protein